MTPSAHTAGGRQVRRWTRDTILAKIVEWNDRYGEPPCSADWNPSLARWRAQEWRVERYYAGTWPSTNAVKRPFGGSFSEAVRAAGFEPRRSGPVPRVPRPAAVPEAEAIARTVALERRLAAAERRAEKAEQRTAEARRRARAAAEQATRARRARERALAAGVEEREAIVEQAARAIEDADMRVCAATDQAEAAVRDAAADRAALRTALAGGAAGRPERPRSGGPAGPGVLGAALRDLARARAAGDRAGLTRALGEVAAAAAGWRERL